MTDQYASEEETRALLRKDTRTPAERKLDRMLEERGASEQGAEPLLILRQIALELLAEQPAQQEPVGCEGAVVNGRVYADRLEHGYSFECEAGSLHLCTDWVEFRRCFEWLTQHTSPPPQRKPLDAGEISRLWKQHTNEDGPYHNPYDDDALGFARAIEAAHGIKENT